MGALGWRVQDALGTRVDCFLFCFVSMKSVRQSFHDDASGTGSLSRLGPSLASAASSWYWEF